MKKADQPTYIQRDLNLDYHTFPKVNKYWNLLFQHSFIPAVTRSPRISENKAILTDNINRNSFIDSSTTTGILKVDVSDHFPVFIAHELSQIAFRKKDTFVTRRDLSKNLKNY